MTTIINVKMGTYKDIHGLPVRGLSSVITFDNGLEKVESDIFETNPIDFINDTMNELTGILIRREYETQDVTITLPSEITLSEALKTHIADKFTADPLINSITFA